MEGGPKTCGGEEGGENKSTEPGGNANDEANAQSSHHLTPLNKKRTISYPRLAVQRLSVLIIVGGVAWRDEKHSVITVRFTDKCKEIRF